MSLIIQDSSGWVWAVKTGILRPMQQHHKIIIPPEIENEVDLGVKNGYRDALIYRNLINDEVIEVVKVGKNKINEVRKITGMKKENDIAVVALAMDQDGVLHTDDNRCENAALLMGVSVTSTTGVVIDTYERGSINRGQALSITTILENEGYPSESVAELREFVRGD